MLSTLQTSVCEACLTRQSRPQIVVLTGIKYSSVVTAVNTLVRRGLLDERTYKDGIKRFRTLPFAYSQELIKSTRYYPKQASTEYFYNGSKISRQRASVLRKGGKIVITVIK
jgi:hypothetical protein